MATRKLLIIILFLCGFTSASAQDIILKRDASEIEAKILEISDTELRYKSWTNIEGPTRVLKLSDVFRIKYSNGEVEVFDLGSDASQDVDGLVPGGYKVGDIYEKDGIRGIVVNTTDNGRHGLIMHPQSANIIADYEYWCANSVDKIGIGMFDENDGMRNLMILTEFIESGVNEKAVWEKYPVYAACLELGEGWYVPAINELKYIVEYMCGGDITRFTDLAAKEFEETIVGLGGDKYAYYYFLFSSTERTEKEFYGYKKTIMSNAGYGFFATVNYGFEKCALRKHSQIGEIFYVRRF